MRVFVQALVMIFTLPAISGAAVEHIGGVKGFIISKNVANLESTMKEMEGIEKWFNKVSISGSIKF